MLYRIYTENKNYEQVKKLVAYHLQGATIIKAEGFWQGQWEQSLVIEVCNPLAGGNVYNLADCIKELNKQDTILVIKINETGHDLR